MAFNVEKSALPIQSKISEVLTDAYFYDCYSFCTKKKSRKSLQIWIDHVSQTPSWINFLMASRNKLVSSFGLKNLGHLGVLNVDKVIDDYKIGDRVGIFTLVFISDNEIILGDSDKHLDVKVSVYKDNNESDLISISTVVHVHNLLGKLYMLFVKPMHKLIVPSSIRRAESFDSH